MSSECSRGAASVCAISGARNTASNSPEASFHSHSVCLGISTPWRPKIGLSRLGTRFYGRPAALEAAHAVFGKTLGADEAMTAGLVTFAPDDIDLDDDVRLALAERNSFSPDALTGLEANLRFVGPETMETKIFGRLTAWQNWIFQRPNAIGPEGALKRFGSGARASFDRARV